MVCKVSKDKNNNLTFVCRRGKSICNKNGFSGKILRKLRLKKRWSLETVALSVLISPQRLAGAEDNNDELHPLTIERLAKLYNVNKKEFFVNPKEIEKKDNELIQKYLKSIK